MKKLLMTLTSVLSAGVIYADAQFYEMELTVKTTKTRSGKVSGIACDCRTDLEAEADGNLYRKQGTVKIKGVIWGCDCGTLIKGERFTKKTEPFGYLFWNVTDRKWLNVTLTWPIANRIDKKANKTEVVWMLTSNDPELPFHLVGSGFGTLKDTVSKNPCKLVTSRFVQIKGGFAGWMAPDAVVTTKATAEECSWCEKIPGTPEVSAVAKGWTVCADCSASDLNAGSAAYGNWKIKYNATASEKLEGATEVTEAYAFPAYVKAAMDSVEEAYGQAQKDAAAAADKEKTAIETAANNATSYATDAATAAAAAQAAADAAPTSEAAKSATDDVKAAAADAKAAAEEAKAAAAVAAAAQTAEEAEAAAADAKAAAEKAAAAKKLAIYAKAAADAAAKTAEAEAGDATKPEEEAAAETT